MTSIEKQLKAWLKENRPQYKYITHGDKIINWQDEKDKQKLLKRKMQKIRI